MSAQREPSTMTADELTWPGVDRERAISAAWHLERAAQLLAFTSRHPATRRQIAPATREHIRTARGYLGAVGFEHAAGLWR